jgi:PAS domain S-box-containing protein
VPALPNESPRSVSREAARYIAGVLALALAYFLGATAALQFAADPSKIAFIWPPTGIAVAVLFRAGLRYWPGVLLGALVYELQIFPWWVAVPIAGGNVLGPVVAVDLLRRFRYDGAGRRSLYAFLLAGLVGMTIPATNALVWRAASGLPADELVRNWLVWWLGDTVGLVIVGPPLLTAVWFRPSRDTARRGALLAVTALLACLAFTNLVPAPERNLLVFLPFMLLLWVGMTERLPVGALHVLVLAVIAVGATAGGLGPFGFLPPVTKMLMLWALATTAALIVLAITAALAERERAEAALVATATDYQALVDGTPAAILRYTADGTLTFVNETLCRVLGRPRGALIGHSVLDFIPDMPRADAVADLPVASTFSGPAAGASGMIRKPDGSCRWYRWTARLITTASGAREFQAVGIDLTERRQSESERAALERKMQDAQRLEALGVLAGGVAHDFNNLLAGVLGHAELAVAALPTGHPARDHLATVLSGVAQAGGLTRQLLAYSGKGRFMLRSLDLNDLIVQTTELLRLTLPKKVQLNLDLAADLPHVTGDDGQLRQVLMNLIINAGEAIGDRSGTVTVTTLVHELLMDAVSGGVYSPAAPGRFVELIVADNGCGMDEATKAKLFDPFFTTKFAGRGLGLSAVLGIIRGHGGGVRVDSRVGIGTRFTVLLPVAAEAPSNVAVTTPAPVAGLLTDTPPAPPPIRRDRRSGPVPMPARRTVPAAKPTTQLTPLRIPHPAPLATTTVEPRGLALVADDEPTVRQVGELMLKQMGYEVLTATNGEEAVALFTANADRVRLILLDLMMPVMDGTEALSAIRAQSAVPVILCSGYTSEAVPEALANDTVTGFLQKPFARAELQKAVASVGA